MDKEIRRGTGRALIIGALTVAAIVVASILWYRNSCEEAAHFDATRRQMFAFANVLLEWSSEHEKIPGPGLADAIKAIKQDKDLSERLCNCPLVVECRDAWGTTLVYRVDPTGRKVTITSAGPNRKDDNGQLDDMREEVVLPSAVPPTAVIERGATTEPRTP